MEVFEKCLALTFSLMILAQAYFVRRSVGTWLFPACLFGLFWFGVTFFPLAILFWVPVQPYSIAFIFLCSLAFSIGSLPFDWRTAFELNTQKRQTVALVYGSPFLKVVFYILTLSSLVFLILNALVQGFSLRDLVFDLYASATTYADLRYSEGLVVNAFDRLSTVCAYLGVIVGGLLFYSVPTKKGRWSIIILSFLPSTLVAVTQSAKYLLFLCIVFFYAGVLVHRISTGRLHLPGVKAVKWATLGLLILVPILTISFLSRGLNEIEDKELIINKLVSYFASYSSGHVYAFSDWFAFATGIHSEFAYSSELNSHGFYTFATLFKLLGSNRVLPIGFFDDYYSYGDLLTTNIFTMFRGLILDFGIIGSLLFMFATGILFHRSFHRMLLHTRPVFSVAAFIFMMAYIYTSFIISLLGANMIYYLTFVLLWIVLAINELISKVGSLSGANVGGNLVPRVPSRSFQA